MCITPTQGTQGGAAVQWLLSDSDSRLVRAFRDTDGTKGECGHNLGIKQVPGTSVVNRLFSCKLGVLIAG